MKNLKPDPPAIEVDIDTGEVTITPPAYENAGDDTDLASYTITYKDASGAEKIVNATRTVNEASGKTTWTADNATVDANTGVITLKVEDIEVGGTVTATAKDNGGLDGDSDKLDSDPATKTLETATVSYDSNGGTGTMESQKNNKGAKYKLLDNAFTPPAQKSFKGWKIGETEYAPGDEIQALKDKRIVAVWQDKPATKVTLTFDPNGGNWDGDMANKIFKEEKGKNFTIIPAPLKDGHKFLYWKGSEFKPGDNYLVEGDHTFVAEWEPSEIPYIEVPVYPNQTVVEPIEPITQPTVQTSVTPVTPSPMVYTLPATGCVDAGLTIWAGLGLALAGLLLKKRG
ncbi:MAG: InlB B-repeat-containing protein [Eubacteriales bacterium]|nr:InlB B-repeat-containing protein [Clostridiales bacterium]MDY5836449.1 InlB B-repeat-containing protein [Eubacteriales bacterium]